MWEKGESGNPGGKPRIQRKFQELLALEIQARSGGQAAKYFCRRLVDFMECDNLKVAFSATALGLAYFAGKPHSMIEVNHTVNIAERLRKARERAGLPALTAEVIPLVVPDEDETTNPI